MGQGRRGLSWENFDEQMYGHSLGVIFFLEAALKRPTTATETKVK